MSEALFTSSQLKEYLSTIDKTLDSNKKVLSEIQSLHIRYMNEILYYLINGRIDISELYSFNINNLSIQAIITSLVANIDDLFDRTEFYKTTIRALPNYTNFKNSVIIESPYRISRLSQASSNFIKPVIIDPLGITADSYTTMVTVRSLYDSFTVNSTSLSLLNSINIKKQELIDLGLTNISIFHDFILAKIANYIFVYNSAAEKYPAVDSNTIIGNIIRNRIQDLAFTESVNKLNLVTRLMANDYDLDIAKLGVYTINNIMTNEDYSWNKLFNIDINSPTLDIDFLDNFSKISFIRYVLFNIIYGSTYFNQEDLDNEILIYNTFIEYCNRIKLYCDNIILLCNENLY